VKNKIRFVNCLLYAAYCQLIPMAIGTAYCLLPPIAIGTAYFSLSSCSQKDQKLNRYFIQGEELYNKHCSNCHQKNGTGLGLVYPPVDVSDYLESNMADVICLIENGKRGELVVNGKSFNQPMPGNPLLTDLEIAEIATYLYNNWGREKGLIDVADVTAILSTCK
jgi:cytochrome c551